MLSSIKCPLCKSETQEFFEGISRKYHKCKNCFSIMLDPDNYVTKEKEKARYETHNNDVKDPRYQKFVSPIVESVKCNYGTNHIGLDYGAGPGPVITSLLEKEGYNINLYDPYFHYYPDKLSIKYDYIICSEVIEHFHNPYDEFKALTKILKASASIFCLTSLYDEEIDFKNWNYKNDETHVFFYHKKAIEWIKNEFNFSSLLIDGKLIKFTR